MRIPATLFFGQTFRPYILLFAEIWQGSGGHVVFQNRPKINTKQAIFRLYKSATTHLWQPSKSTKKNPMAEHLKKETMVAILLTPVAAILFFRISRKRFPGKFFQ